MVGWTVVKRHPLVISHGALAGKLGPINKKETIWRWWSIQPAMVDCKRATNHCYPLLTISDINQPTLSVSWQLMTIGFPWLCPKERLGLAVPTWQGEPSHSCSCYRSVRVSRVDGHLAKDFFCDEDFWGPGGFLLRGIDHDFLCSFTII